MTTLIDMLVYVSLDTQGLGVNQVRRYWHLRHCKCLCGKQPSSRRLFDIQEDFFHMRMTEIIHWLSCRIVAPLTLAHPFLVIIISSLYKKKRMASFSKAYGDNLSTLHCWHMLSSPNFSKVFDEYRVTNTTWYNTTPWILQCRSNLYVFFLILIKSKNLSPFLAMVLIWLKRWWFKVGQGCAIRQFPPRQNLSFTVLFDIKWLVIRTNLQLPYLHRRLFS